MSTILNGFNPENLERIYAGEPALVGKEEESVENVLGDREYEVAKLAAEGASYSQIASEQMKSISTIQTQLHTTYVKLGIHDKIGLVGYFPIEPEDPRLERKALVQLSPRPLEIIEGLSKGKAYKAIAKDMWISTSAARTHMHRASLVWGDCEGALMITRVANGIRANYARNILRNGNDISRHLGTFALPNLVEYEPRLRRLFKMPELLPETAKNKL